MKIPEVRNELRALAASHGIPRLAELADELVRRSPQRRAAKTSRPMDDQTADLIRAMAAAYPDWSAQKVANACEVNPGRVSEILNGRRT